MASELLVSRFVFQVDVEVEKRQRKKKQAEADPVDLQKNESGNPENMKRFPRSNQKESPLEEALQSQKTKDHQKQ